MKIPFKYTHGGVRKNTRGNIKHKYDKKDKKTPFSVTEQLFLTFLM